MKELVASSLVSSEPGPLDRSIDLGVQIVLVFAPGVPKTFEALA
jgi:hypothetical protein